MFRMHLWYHSLNWGVKQANVTHAKHQPLTAANNHKHNQSYLKAVIISSNSTIMSFQSFFLHYLIHFMNIQIISFINLMFYSFNGFANVLLKSKLPMMVIVELFIWIEQFVVKKYQVCLLSYIEPSCTGRSDDWQLKYSLHSVETWEVEECADQNNQPTEPRRQQLSSMVSFAFPLSLELTNIIYYNKLLIIHRCFIFRSKCTNKCISWSETVSRIWAHLLITFTLQ